jgi:xanthine dehydrogenase molybdenum-binding subunit
MDVGGVFKKSDPSKKMTYSQVFARIPVSAAREVIGYSYRRAPDGNCVPKETGASCVSLDVDTETGQVFNVKIATANQVGRVMNPKLQFNQGNMGAVKGAHCALLTDNVTDKPTGKNLTYNWIYYPYPTIMEYEVTNDNPELYGDKSHPYGAKAASEGQPNPHAGAVANAIYNAIGVRIKELPITPDKVLKALGKI